MSKTLVRSMKSMCSCNLASCFAILVFFGDAGSLCADSITFQGSILRDDDIRVFTIIVDQPTSVNIRSVGYAGDPFSDLGIISPGGFDTYLTLFDSMGSFVAENDDGDDATVDPTTGQAFDAQLQEVLDPGVFSLWLTQYGNYSLGPNDSSGFSQVGNGSYTNDPSFNPGDPCPSGLFKDSSGSDGACRTGNYSLEFLNDQGATAYYALVASSSAPPPPAVPEPGTYATLITGISAIITLFAFRGRMSWSSHRANDKTNFNPGTSVLIDICVVKTS